MTECKTDKINELLEAYHQLGQFNGSVLVAAKGEVIYKKGFGMANMEWGLPNTPATKHRLGSITKQFAAVAILQLVEQDKVCLEGVISDYLPYYRQDTGRLVTVHQLLNHTSGIPSYTNTPGFFKAEGMRNFSTRDFVLKFCSGILEFRPGSEFVYNNSGYVILGAIIEEVAKQPFAQYLKEKICQPLGMNSTGYDYSQPLMEQRAAGYSKTLDGFENAPYLDMTIPHAAGAMYSTVEDFFLWDQALYTDKVLTANSKELMFTPYLENYGYGWRIAEIFAQEEGDKRYNPLTIGHAGGIHGFHTNFIRIPKDKHCIVLFNNTGGTKLNEITMDVASILYDRPYKMPEKSLSEVLYHTYLENGLTDMLNQCQRLKDKQEEGCEGNPMELFQLAQQLIKKGEFNGAIEVLQLNVETYPEFSMNYMALAGCHMLLLDREKSVQLFAKAMEVDPKAPHVVAMTQHLLQLFFGG